MNNCSCIDIWADEVLEPISHRVIRARKSHVCGECGRTVAPGEEYERFVGVLDGTVTTHKTCLDCVSIRDAFFCQGWFYGQIWEDVWNHVQDLQGDLHPTCFVDLTPRAEKELRELIERYLEEEEEELDG